MLDIVGPNKLFIVLKDNLYDTYMIQRHDFVKPLAQGMYKDHMLSKLNFLDKEKNPTAIRNRSTSAATCTSCRNNVWMMLLLRLEKESALKDLQQQAVTTHLCVFVFFWREGH